MATLGEIAEALAAAASGAPDGVARVGLMQCTSVYPAPAERANLRAMETMRRGIRRARWALRSHRPASPCPIAAAALGAAFVEKHYTLDRGDEGS